MKAIKFGITAVALAGLSLPVQGGQFVGGKGFLHTNTALLLPAGALDVSLYARGYVVGIDEDTAAHKSAFTMSNGTGAITTTFGFTRKVEIGFSQILYQDINYTFTAGRGKSAMIPGDTYLRFKVGGYNFGEKLFFSYMPMLRYRVALYHDVQLEPYESEGIEVELMAIMSYYQKPFYPDEALSMHFNLAYLNHNDADNPNEASQSVFFLLGGVYPTRRLDFGGELYGSVFAKRPPVKVLGREDWAYVTPFVRYRLFKGMNITMGVDALLMGYKDTSKPGHRSDWGRFPNYSKWRITGKVSFAPSTAFYAVPTFARVEEPGTAGRARMAAGATGGMDRQALFHWAIEERAGQIEAADLDLQKIRQERIKAEEELKRLKRKLEEKQKGQ